jgi:hypothetical protein
MGNMKNTSRIVFGKFEEKRLLERLRHCRCKGNIKVDVKEISRIVWTEFIWCRIRSSCWPL